MIPFARVLKYGNEAVVPPKPYNLLVQANYNNVLIQIGSDLYGYGVNNYGQLGAGNNSPQPNMVHVLSSVDRFFGGTLGSMAITTDAKVMWAGRDLAFPEAGYRTAWFDVTSIFEKYGIYTHMIKDIQIGESVRVLTYSGDFYYTGHNGNSECGVSQTPINTLTKSTFGSIDKIRGSIRGTHFVMSNGDAYFCGDNTAGCAGLGVSTATIVTPTKVTNNVYDISAMYQATQWLKNDGSIWYSGYGTYGQLSTPGVNTSTTMITKNTAIPLIDIESTKVVITSEKGNSTGVGGMLYTNVDGVRHSGANTYGRIGRGDVGGASQLALYTIPSISWGGVSNIVGYSSIYNASFILTSDNKLYACGGGTTANTYLPDGSSNVSTMKLMENMPWY